MTVYFLFKVFHIIGFVSWFAGLFYLVRIFVYHREAFDKPSHEREVLVPQFQLMEQRVYRIILTPAMMITWICGIAMLHINGGEWFKANSWMHVKLLLLVLLSGYHGYCGKLIKRLKAEKVSLNSYQYRLLNELPTLFLLAIVMLAVFRNTLSAFTYIGVVIGFGVLLFLAVNMYKKSRKKQSSK